MKSQYNYLEAIDEGIRLWWRAIGKMRGFTHGAGDFEWVLSENRSGPERIFNVRIAQENAGGKIDEIVEAIRSRSLPGGILLTPLSTPRDIVERLAGHGLHIDSSCPCMALELDTFRTDKPGAQIAIAELDGTQALRAWAGIVNTGLFGCELFSLDQYSDLLAQENTRLYVASLEGTSASACMTIQGAGTATLECVATLPEYRRKGLGAAVVSRALERLREHGIATATLRSEPDGVALYEKLGFSEVCRRVVASYS